MEFRSITKTVTVVSKGATFVDDTGLGSNYPPHELQNNIETLPMIEHTIVCNLQSLSQEWERLLFSIGGALNLSKCFWFMLSWRWANGIPTIATKTNTHQHLCLTSGTDTATVDTSRIDPHNTFCTLGVYIMPNGSCEDAFSRLVNSALEYASAVTSTYLTRDTALTSYIQQFLSKLQNQLLAISLNYQQC
jgi:hypothetical protein